jgi:hypothetical protein
MANLFNRFQEFPQHHVTITPADSDLPRPMIIYCGSSGTIVARDENNVVVTYTVTAGEIIPVLVKRVAAASTVTQVIGLY